MIKAKLLLALLLLTCIQLLAQTTPQVILPTFDDDYCRTVKKLEAGDVDIDYAAFRDSYIDSKQFVAAKKQSHQFDSLRTLMYKQMSGDDYNAIIGTTKAMLSIDYTSMIAHKILRQTYKILGDTANAAKYKSIQFGLLRSIINSGDGKTCATGWHVVQIEEEYFILQMLGADLQEQSVEGGCDRMEVKENGKIKVYYFEVGKVFESYMVK